MFKAVIIDILILAMDQMTMQKGERLAAKELVETKTELKRE